MKETIQVLWKEESFMMAFKGLSARLIQSVMFSFFIILGYESIKRLSLLEEYRKDVRWWNSYSLFIFFKIFKIFITVRAENLFYFTAKINSQFKGTSSDFLIVSTVYYEIFFFLFNTLEASNSSLCILFFKKQV